MLPPAASSRGPRRKAASLRPEGHPLSTTRGELRGKPPVSHLQPLGRQGHWGHTASPLWPDEPGQLPADHACRSWAFSGVCPLPQCPLLGPVSSCCGFFSSHLSHLGMEEWGITNENQANKQLPSAEHEPQRSVCKSSPCGSPPSCAFPRPKDDRSNFFAFYKLQRSITCNIK